MFRPWTMQRNGSMSLRCWVCAVIRAGVLIVCCRFCGSLCSEVCPTAAPTTVPTAVPTQTMSPSAVPTSSPTPNATRGPKVAEEPERQLSSLSVWYEGAPAVILLVVCILSVMANVCLASKLIHNNVWKCPKWNYTALEAPNDGNSTPRSTATPVLELRSDL